VGTYLAPLGIQKIFERVVTGAAVTDIDIPNLNLERDKLYILILNILNPTLSDENIYLFYNDRFTLTEYASQYHRASGTTSSGAGYAAREANPKITTVNASYSTFAIVWIAKSPDRYIRANSIGQRSHPGTVEMYNVFMGRQILTDNVTKMTLRSSNANGIGINSRVELWRMTR